MRLEHLYYIVEISKTRSISQAADNLFVTQPTLSIAVSSLEKELSMKLFERTKSGVYPTTEGQKVINLANEILAKLDGIRSVGAEPQPNNLLRVLTIPAVNSNLLQNAIITFHSQYPEVQTYVREEKPAVLVDAFLQKAHETPRWFGICSLSDNLRAKREKQLQKLQVAYEFLGDDEMVCFVSADHPLAQQQTITMAACRTLSKIKYQYHPEYQQAGEGGERYHDDSTFGSLYDEGAVLTVSTLESLKKLVAENVGVTVMPSAIIADDPYLRDGRIKILRFSDFTMPLHYHILYSKQQPLTPMEQAFVEQIKIAFGTCFPGKGI